MPSGRLPPPLWVDTPAALKKLAGELARQTRIAVDTESNGLHAFREQVCLIQFSTARVDYLVDPLALASLAPLAAIFADPGIEKVFHAAEYDLICLKRDFGFTVAHLFDTMQAAHILGYKLVGLDAVMLEKLGVQINKHYQKADWGERPISPEMLNYARLDTHHLLDLRDSLETELKQRGRWELAQEEFVRQAHGNGTCKPEVPAWQRAGRSQKLTGRQLALLKELCAWRDKQAKRMGRPAFKVLDDKRLVSVASAAPKAIGDLEALDLTPRQIRLYGNDLLRAVARGQKAAPLSRPRPVRPNPAVLGRLDVLTNWRKHAALKLELESDIILPKCWVQSIAEKNPKSLDELAVCMPASPWRLEHFGQEILDTIGKIKSK